MEEDILKKRRCHNRGSFQQHVFHHVFLTVLFIWTGKLNVKKTCKDEGAKHKRKPALAVKVVHLLNHEDESTVFNSPSGITIINHTQLISVNTMAT